MFGFGVGVGGGIRVIVVAVVAVVGVDGDRCSSGVGDMDSVAIALADIVCCIISNRGRRSTGDSLGPVVVGVVDSVVARHIRGGEGEEGRGCAKSSKVGSDESLDLWCVFEVERFS